MALNIFISNINQDCLKVRFYKKWGLLMKELIGIAAAAVTLVGGTLIYRNSSVVCCSCGKKCKKKEIL